MCRILRTRGSPWLRSDSSKYTMDNVCLYDISLLCIRKHVHTCQFFICRWFLLEIRIIHSKCVHFKFRLRAKRDIMFFFLLWSLWFCHIFNFHRKLDFSQYGVHFMDNFYFPSGPNEQNAMKICMKQNVVRIKQWVTKNTFKIQLTIYDSITFFRR